ncbi:HEAT repeat domain-containing protein [Capnocytophaga sp. oral taxon 902]|uniref:HEAT repeat domain-containing protein n=1 Tax=Capnocytophaga sp. oral taxon 902 TaxID=2748316 RepID=UPI0015BA5D21|nr:HEAT repeat domain-containing protein [Capnocytophaga sp. oral taxon 902]QLF51266.1 HEAT repeat domain-containing protein [Capnocytophaga sp. oral taxon 902]
MKPLYDLQQELNRLFIAGSKFAKNDPRLQKYIPILKKLGEKAPVFNKLAQEVEALLQVESQQSAEKLLNVSTLLYSVLYTQGVTIQAEATKALQEPNVSIADVNTTYSYLQLKPVLQALTQSNSGRLEVLKDAFERGIFKDSRTFGYLSYALADKYTELADYVLQTIIPTCGQAMLPFLLSDFRLEDKTENVRRLRLLYQLKYAQMDSLTDKIFDESLPNLQAEAISIIAERKDTQTEDFIMSLTSDKNKLVREASYKALAILGTQRSIDKLLALYETNKAKGNAKALAEAISLLAIPSHYQPFLKKVYEQFNILLSIEKTDNNATVTNAFERFAIDLDILENKDCNEVYEFLSELLQSQKFNTLRRNLFKNTYDPIPMKIVGILNSFEADKVVAFYDKHKQYLTFNSGYNDLWINFFWRAFNNENFSKEQLFETFSTTLGKSLATGSMLEAFSGTNGYYTYTVRKCSEVRVDRIDPRWIPVFYSFLRSLKKLHNNYALNTFIILDALEKDGKSLDEWLLKALSETFSEDTIWLYHLILKRNLPNKYELVYHSLEKIKAGNAYYFLYNLSDTDFWKQFPKEYAQKFRILAEKNKLKIFKEIAEEIERG